MGGKESVAMESFGKALMLGVSVVGFPAVQEFGLEELRELRQIPVILADNAGEGDLKFFGREDLHKDTHQSGWHKDMPW